MSEKKLQLVPGIFVLNVADQEEQPSRGFWVTHFHVVRSSNVELPEESKVFWVVKHSMRNAWDWLGARKKKNVYAYVVERRTMSGQSFLLPFFSDTPVNRCPHCNAPGIYYQDVLALRALSMVEPCVCVASYHAGLNLAMEALTMFGALKFEDEEASVHALAQQYLICLKELVCEFDVTEKMAISRAQTYLDGLRESREYGR